MCFPTVAIGGCGWLLPPAVSEAACVAAAAARSLPPPTGRPGLWLAGMLPPLKNGPAGSCRNDCYTNARRASGQGPAPRHPALRPSSRFRAAIGASRKSSFKTPELDPAAIHLERGLKFSRSRCFQVFNIIRAPPPAKKTVLNDYRLLSISNRLSKIDISLFYMKEDSLSIQPELQHEPSVSFWGGGSAVLLPRGSDGGAGRFLHSGRGGDYRPSCDLETWKWHQQRASLPTRVV